MTNASVALNVTSYRAALVAAFDARKAFEGAKNAENDTIQSKLDAMRKGVDHDVIASIMLASNCDAERINREERKGARYNVYAYEKDINIARSIAKVASLNHYTRHILLTAKALHDNDMLLTHDDAFCACLKGSKPKDAKKAKLINRYVKTEVATGTASTQSSSSINALQSFNVLVETRDATGHVAYRLNDTGAECVALLATLA